MGNRLFLCMYFIIFILFFIRKLDKDKSLKQLYKPVIKGIIAIFENLNDTGDTVFLWNKD